MRCIALVVFWCCFVHVLCAQAPAEAAGDSTAMYKIVTAKGGAYVGKILHDDGRELLLETQEVGKLYLMKTEVRNISKLEEEQVSSPENNGLQAAYATKYAVLPNALPLRKGERFATLSLFGPEAHFAITNRLSAGAATSWITSPMVLQLKYSFRKKESKLNFAVGAFLGSMGFISSFKTNGALYWGSITLGGRQTNISVTAGYFHMQSGMVRNLYREGSYSDPDDYSKYREIAHLNGPMLALGGIVGLGKKMSLLFDATYLSYYKVRSNVHNIIISNSYYSNGTYYPSKYITEVKTVKTLRTIFLFSPGFRLQSSPTSAWQLCLAGMSVYGDPEMSFPMPLVSWMCQF